MKPLFSIGLTVYASLVLADGEVAAVQATLGKLN